MKRNRIPLPPGRGQGEGAIQELLAAVGSLAEMIGKGRVSILSGVVLRRLSFLVAHRPIGAMLEQEVDHLGLAVQSGFHERGESKAAGALPGVHRCAPLEE